MKLALRRNAVKNAGLWARFACWLIKARLVSVYCHGAIVIGRRVYESTAKGLHSSTFVEGDWDLFDLGNERDLAALNLFEQHMGAGYDWFSLLAFALPWPARDARRFYCFEWCHLAITGGNPGSRVTPETLLIEIRGQS